MKPYQLYKLWIIINHELLKLYTNILLEGLRKTSAYYEVAKLTFEPRLIRI